MVKSSFDSYSLHLLAGPAYYDAACTSQIFTYDTLTYYAHYYASVDCIIFSRVIGGGGGEVSPLNFP